jgi:hypothetical protein
MEKRDKLYHSIYSYISYLIAVLVHPLNSLSVSDNRTRTPPVPDGAQKLSNVAHGWYPDGWPSRQLRPVRFSQSHIFSKAWVWGSLSLKRLWIWNPYHWKTLTVMQWRVTFNVETLWNKHIILTDITQIIYHNYEFEHKEPKQTLP